jgi:predicted CXXCH cytochrome family protein
MMMKIFAAMLLFILLAQGNGPEVYEPPGLSRRSSADIMPGFTNSAHDFFGPDAPMAVRCAPCHATEPPEAVEFQWDPRAETVRRFDSGAGRGAAPRPRYQLADSTRQCLSCHDGTLASEIIGGGDDAELFALGAVVNPRRDHPVGVVYPQSGRTGEGRRREYVPIGRLEAEGRIKLPAGRVECISCHDPHNAFGQQYMLVKSDRRSALCLSCHIK